MRNGFILVLALLGPGCLHLPENPREDAPAAALLPLGKSLGPDQVTPQNAHTLSQALWDELDRDGHGPSSAARKKVN